MLEQPPSVHPWSPLNFLKKVQKYLKLRECDYEQMFQELAKFGHQKTSMISIQNQIQMMLSIQLYFFWYRAPQVLFRHKIQEAPICFCHNHIHKKSDFIEMVCKVFDRGCTGGAMCVAVEQPQTSIIEKYQKGMYACTLRQPNAQKYPKLRGYPVNNMYSSCMLYCLHANEEFTAISAFTPNSLGECEQLPV